MNKELLSNIMNEYEEVAYNEIIKDLDIAIKEAKEKNLNPIETYKYIRSKQEKLEQELTNMFSISISTPLSEDALSKLDKYLDPYATNAIEYAKQEVNKRINNLNNEEYLEVYDELSKKIGL